MLNIQYIVLPAFCCETCVVQVSNIKEFAEISWIPYSVPLPSDSFVVKNHDCELRERDAQSRSNAAMNLESFVYGWIAGIATVFTFCEFFLRHNVNVAGAHHRDGERTFCGVDRIDTFPSGKCHARNGCMDPRIVRVVSIVNLVPRDKAERNARVARLVAFDFTEFTHHAVNTCRCVWTAATTLWLTLTTQATINFVLLFVMVSLPRCLC